MSQIYQFPKSNVPTFGPEKNPMKFPKVLIALRIYGLANIIALKLKEFHVGLPIKPIHLSGTPWLYATLIDILGLLPFQPGCAGWRIIGKPNQRTN